MSDADRVSIQVAKETTFGVAPTGGFESTRFTSETLTGETATTNSANMRPDRNTDDVVRTNVEASCDISQEMDLNFRQPTTNNATINLRLLEGAVNGTWLQSGQHDVTLGLSSGKGPLINDYGGGTSAGTNGDGAGPNFTLHSYSEGEEAANVPIHGISRKGTGSDSDFNFNISYGALTNRTWYRFHPIHVDSVVHKNKANVAGGNFFRTRVDRDPQNAGGGGAEIKWDLDGSEILNTVDMGTTAATDHIVMEQATYELTNGFADSSFSIEKGFLDVNSGEGERGRGLTVDTLTISANKDSILTHTYSFQGKRVQQMASTPLFTLTFSGSTGSLTSATATLSGTTLTLVVTGGSSAGTTTVDLTNASYDTVSELSAHITGLSAWTTENHRTDLANYGSKDLKEFSIFTVHDGSTSTPKQLTDTRKLTSHNQVAASTRQILNTIEHIGGVYVTSHRSSDGTLRTTPMLRPLRGVTSVELAISSGLSARKAIGELGVQSYHKGAIAVTGTIQMYYDESTKFQVEDLYETFKDSGLAFAFEEKATNSHLVTATTGLGSTSDDTNHAMVIDLPRVKWTSITRNVTGTGTDIIGELQFQAFYFKQDHSWASAATYQVDETMRVSLFCPQVADITE